MGKYIKKQDYVQHNADELATSIKGSINELVVCTYFLQKGYEVYRNVSPTGKGDIVIWDRKTTPIIIDVKTAYKKEGKDRIVYNICKSRVPNVETVGVVGNNEILETITLGQL